MKISNIIASGKFSAVSVSDEEREISGIYIGDLLSWVMGRAQADNAWITIMSNINIVAVASLVDVACIILAEGVELEASVIETAKSKGINILATALPAYEAAMELSGLRK